MWGSDAVNGADFTGATNKITASSADAVLYGGSVQGAAALRDQLTHAHWSGAFVGGASMFTAQYIAESGSSSAEGSIAFCSCPPDSLATEAFKTQYKAAFAIAPSSGSNVSWDAANMFIQGIAAGHTTRASMLTWINGYKHQGMTKSFAFDPSGEQSPATADIWAYRVHSGTFAPIQITPIN
jgi:branched-chain amino acid transport system substrate-binding protein